MIEIVVLIACTVLMMKIADHEQLSSIIWGAITAGLCILCLAIPLPYFRMLIALGLSFVLMTVYNAKYGGPR